MEEGSGGGHSYSVSLGRTDLWGDSTSAAMGTQEALIWSMGGATPFREGREGREGRAASFMDFEAAPCTATLNNINVKVNVSISISRYQYQCQDDMYSSVDISYRNRAFPVAWEGTDSEEARMLLCGHVAHVHPSQPPSQ
jgi:hypothetical protein